MALQFPQAGCERVLALQLPPASCVSAFDVQLPRACNHVLGVAVAAGQLLSYSGVAVAAG